MSLTSNDPTSSQGGDNDSEPDFDFISVPDLLKESKPALHTEDIDDVRQRISEQELRERETARLGEDKYYKLRDKWSWFIAFFVLFMLVFQVVLTVQTGEGNWKFRDTTYLHLVIGENFAQIVGMGIIVAKFLFPNKL